MTRSLDEGSAPTETMTEVDLRAIGAALARRRGLIALLTLFAFASIGVFVSVVTPRYTAETQLLLENQETFFTRPDRVNLPTEIASQLDPEAVASQIQLIGSRDIARRAIKALHLEGDPEFDPQARGIGVLKRVLILVGLARDPSRESIDSRIVTAFLEKLTVFSPPKTRVISIQFTSRDPDLAARATNTVASLYLEAQSAAKRATARDSADALAQQIADLRTKLAAADSAREQYRQQSGLLAGTNNMTISGQQLADINTDLSKARTAQADAQAKASTIRELLRNGRAVDVPDVINNDIVRRVSDQRVTAQAQLALEARTLGPGHPRIKALTAEVDEYDLALKTAARQAATTLENDAKIAGARVANLESVLSQQKRVAGVANVDEVHLHELERASQSLKDQLESSNTKYQEALARQSSSATPADARVISRAVPPQDPSFPKKIPFIAFGTIATFVLATGAVVAAELFSGRATVGAVRVIEEPVPEEAVVASKIVTPQKIVTSKIATPDPTPKPPLAPAPVKAPGLRARWRVARAEDDDASPTENLVFAPVAAERALAIAPSRIWSFLSGGALGSLISRFRSFAQSAASARETDDARASDVGVESFGWDQGDAPRSSDTTKPRSDDPARPPVDYASLADRIAATHVPGHGLHVVAAGLGPEPGATDILVTLARTLAEKGRSVIVDLNRTPAKLGVLAAGDGLQAGVMSLKGLSELLAGDASFADVIHRDHASRLHFIPTGRQEADFRDFDLILDALSETYDFIVMLAPAFPRGEIANIMAPYADVVVLSTVTDPDPSTVSRLERDLLDAGAREVIVVGTTPDRVRDVA